jgi:hypothetical protein
MTPNEAQRAVLRALARETEYVAAVDLLMHDRKHQAVPLLAEFRRPLQVGVRLGQLTRMGLAQRRITYGIGQYLITPAGRDLVGIAGPDIPGPSAERVVWERTASGITVAVTDEARVVVEPMSGMQRVVLGDPARLAELQQVLDAAAVEQSRVASRMHPVGRPFTDRVLAELNPQQTVTTRDVASRANLTFNEAHSELLRLRNDGRVTRTGGRWAVKPVAGGNLEWHPGKHGWETHDGYRRHAHSINGQLTIDPADTRVHFAGGTPFRN